MVQEPIVVTAWLVFFADYDNMLLEASWVRQFNPLLWFLQDHIHKHKSLWNMGLFTLIILLVDALLLVVCVTLQSLFHL